MDTKLTLKSELGRVQATTPADRARAVIDSPYTRQILERLSPQETFMLIKDSWGTDSQILLQYVTPETISHIIDMDCWDKDTLSVSVLLDWLWEIYNASVDSLQIALEALDLDIMILLYQTYIDVVQVVPTDERIPDLLDAGYESLDDNYFFLIKEEDEKAQLLKDMLSLIFTHYQDTYYTIMEGVIWELKSYIEENIYEKRSLRLMELGFPPPEEAMSIYRRAHSGKLLSQGLSKEKVPHMDKGRGFLPAVYLDHLSRNTDLVVSSLAEASQETQERFMVEMVYLSNKVVMADYRPLNEVEELKSSIDKASAISSLGLAVAMKRHGGSAGEILGTMNAETLFSLGYNAILDQQMRLKQILKAVDLAMVPEKLSPWAEGLLKKRPLFRDREFSTIEELEELTRTVDMIAALATIMDALRWRENRGSLSNTNTGSALDMETFILTVLAVNLLEKKTGFRPLERDELVGFIRTVTRLDEAGRRIFVPEFGRSLQDFLSALAPDLPRQSIEDASGLLQNRFEDELSGIARIEELDPRFITCFVVRI
ncbi:MAG: DUF6178 family protein [Desulfomonilia bacterium]|jgi:hypothetical protein|nr:DUF6178 family protein [Desulfomonilia bacterium]